MSSTRALAPIVIVLALVALPACASKPQSSPTAAIQAVGTENFYADVIAQIGGSHVHVQSLLDNPNTDPHSYESSTTDADAVAAADLIVQNGIGYDAFMQKLEDASPSSHRVIIDAGSRLGHKTGDNPHLWYDPQNMPQVATMIAETLEQRDPAHAQDYRANLHTFLTSLGGWNNAIAVLRKTDAGSPIAVTEPVFNYSAQAAGMRILTPASFQLAIEEGNDPAPQDVSTVRALLTQHRVKAFVYNQQTVEPATSELLSIARANHIPVIGVYETMPKAMHYQHWMEAEVAALAHALHDKASTETLR